MLQSTNIKKRKSPILAFILPLFFNVFGLLYVSKKIFFIMLMTTIILTSLLWNSLDFNTITFLHLLLPFIGLLSALHHNQELSLNGEEAEVTSLQLNQKTIYYFQLILFVLHIGAASIYMGTIILIHPIGPIILLLLHSINLYVSSRLWLHRTASYFGVILFTISIPLSNVIEKSIGKEIGITPGGSIAILFGIILFFLLFLLTFIFLIVDVYRNSKIISRNRVYQYERTMQAKDRGRGSTTVSYERERSSKEKEMIAAIRPYMKKGYQLCVDTNVLMNPSTRNTLIYFMQKKTIVHVSTVVTDELDKHKMSKRKEEYTKSRAGINALTDHKDYVRQIPKPAGQYVRHLHLNLHDNDDWIIATYHQLLKNGPVLFITGDGNPILSAERVGLSTIRLRSE